MNERIDEDIGALLDGRIAEPRRSELLNRLAADDVDYEVFADTAAVLREAEEEAAGNDSATAPEEVVPPQPDVIPLRPRRSTGWRSPGARWMALAAGVAALTLVPVLRSRMNADGWRDPRRLAALSSPSGAGLPGDWRHEFNPKRGGGGDVPNSGVAAQVGALHLDMEVEAHASDPVDSAAMVPLALTTAATLEAAEEWGPSNAVRDYKNIAELTNWSRPRVLDLLADARTKVVQYVDPDYFAVGAWTEAARLAVRRKDAAFFHTSESRKAVARAVALPGLSDGTKAAAERVRDIQGQGTIQDWKSLESHLDDLQQEISR